MFVKDACALCFPTTPLWWFYDQYWVCYELIMMICLWFMDSTITTLHCTSGLSVGWPSPKEAPILTALLWPQDWAHDGPLGQANLCHLEFKKCRNGPRGKHVTPAHDVMKNGRKFVLVKA